MWDKIVTLLAPVGVALAFWHYANGDVQSGIFWILTALWFKRNQVRDTE